MEQRKKVIEVEIETQHIINEIKKYFTHNGSINTTAVIGISGGKDSTIAAMLCVLALGKQRVIGVMMPEHTQNDIRDSEIVCETLGIEANTINIGPACDALYSELDCTDYVLNNQVKTNTPARLRMATLYAVAAMTGGRVINTCNYSEVYVGYETKYGDGAGDFSILGNYCVREVLEIGEYVREKYFPELPCHLISKTPADGMCGKTDEDNLGFTYAELDAFILDKQIPDYETCRKITEMHKISNHKRQTMPKIYNETKHWKDENYRKFEEVWF